MKPRHCLVTGGAGFIGSHLVEGLTAAGDTVRVLDNFNTGLRENLAHLQPAPEIIEASLTDPVAVRRAVTGIDVVYHLAALASVARSVEAPEESHAACATGTLHVLDGARQCGVKRVVYAGSASAYGGASGDSQDEETPLQPLSPYAAAKLSGELYMEAFASTYGLETARVRFFNIFGPRQRADSPYSGVIAIFAAAFSAKRTVTIHGDGLQARDFTYVTDAVQALMKAATAPAAVGRVYNIGTGTSQTVIDLFSTLKRLFASENEPVFGPARLGDVRTSCANIQKARTELGYEPQVSFEEGLHELLRGIERRAEPIVDAARQNGKLRKICGLH